MTCSVCKQGKNLRKPIIESRLGPTESITKTFMVSIVVVRLMAVIS
jgi:hypothetical protein